MHLKYTCICYYLTNIAPNHHRKAIYKTLYTALYFFVFTVLLKT